MKILLVVNPISGGVNKEPFLSIAQKLFEKYAIDYTIFKTTGRNDSQKLEGVISTYQPDRVLALGGDGTFIFTSVNLSGKWPIGIIPFGSANGMARELGVPVDPFEALKDALLSELVVGLDMLKINDHHRMIHIGDVGINANIVQAYEKDSKRGMATYAKHFMRELQNTAHFDVEIENYGEVTNLRALMVAICNGRKYGTGVPLNLISNPFDGKFEIVIIEDIYEIDLIKAGLSSFYEQFYDSSNTKIIQTDRATIRFDKKRLLQLDGEVVDHFDEITVEVSQRPIPFISTCDNSYLEH